MINTLPPIYPLNPILVVDDEAPILFAIDTALQMAGLNHVRTCQDSRQVMDMLEKTDFEVVLLDLTMPFVDGHQLLDLIHQQYPALPVVIVTGLVEVETAVQCMKQGAFDFVVKPVEEERLLATVQRAIDVSQLKRENLALKGRILNKKLDHARAFRAIVTQSSRLQSIFQYVESIAPTSQGVLISGETGVGKELIARALHTLSRPAGPFVAVNVAGLDDNVFSDTLFGHSKGAFTGADQDRPGLIEQAGNGTLFLDEIGDLNINSQVKLLRLLEEGEYLPLGEDTARRTNARIVASTNADLWQLEKDGRFRKDLIYRLRTHHVHLPPLRERREDLPLLVDHFLTAAAERLNVQKPTVPGQLADLLSTYHFPGNIRELRAMIFDAASQHSGGALSLQVFRDHINRLQREQRATAAFDVQRGSIPDNILFGDTLPTLKEASDHLVHEAMHRAQNNQSTAAAMLGISQQALSKRLKKLDNN